ncbi:hypothetical protein BDZ89DRAFT_1062660 [Hymenopellis radicata]|nr:hypothetical protein BDZ89DRAFT_1062660 [Hymenopellis radicata]
MDENLDTDEILAQRRKRPRSPVSAVSGKPKRNPEPYHSDGTFTLKLANCTEVYKLSNAALLSSPPSLPPNLFPHLLKFHNQRNPIWKRC